MNTTTNELSRRLDVLRAALSRGDIDFARFAFAEAQDTIERVSALLDAAEKWHDSGPRIVGKEAFEEIEGQLVIAIERANPAKYGK